MDKRIDKLAATLGRLAGRDEDRALLTAVVKALDDKYRLGEKIAREAGVQEIITQFAGRIVAAYAGASQVKGKRILDIACGSSTSRAPSFVYINTPLGEARVSIPHTDGYTAQFEPWFCRMLLELGADAVGVDAGDLEGEAFEHYRVDLGQPGALDVLPSRSFDAVQDSRLFGSPEFTARFPDRAAHLRVAREIAEQERRLLKPGGIVIHSDAQDLLR